ncbi:hypothetical protein ACHAXR_010177, partial [Thalassiosira sp. AJA248-18]
NNQNNKQPIILSKTTTPLQRLQQKIKLEEQALRTKRYNRRATNLSAMRLPLAPTAGMSAEKLWKMKKKQKGKGKRKRGGNKAGAGDDDGDDAEEDDTMDENTKNALAIATEIEAERTHRRIATRGVVALFNAISKHRAAVLAEAAAKEEEKRARLRSLEEGGRYIRKKSGNDEDDGGVKTKHGFLDMIKKSATATNTGSGGGNDGGGGGGGDMGKNGVNGSSSKGAAGSKASIGWSALKDDFMMNSKLKDWDKEISDDDDDDEPKKPEPEPTISEKRSSNRKKRQKV